MSVWKTGGGYSLGVFLIQSPPLWLQEYSIQLDENNQCRRRPIFETNYTGPSIEVLT